MDIEERLTLIEGQLAQLIEGQVNSRHLLGEVASEVSLIRKRVDEVTEHTTRLFRKSGGFEDPEHER